MPIFRWKRKGKSLHFSTVDVADFYSACKSGNRMSALRKAVLILDRASNDPPTGLHPNTRAEFPYEPDKLEDLAGKLEDLYLAQEITANRQELIDSTEALAGATEAPTKGGKFGAKAKPGFVEIKPPVDPQAPANPPPTELVTGEEGVGMVPWILIAELILMVIKAIRDYRQQDKTAGNTPVKSRDSIV